MQGPPQNQAGQYGLPPLPEQPVAPAPQAGLVDIHAHMEEIIRNSFGAEARPAIRPVFRSLYPSNGDMDMEHPYLADWKTTICDKFSKKVAENTVGHINRG